MSFWRRTTEGSAVAERDERTVDELFDEIEALGQANRAKPDPEVEQRLQRLRHVAGARLVDAPPDQPEQAAPDFDALPSPDAQIPEVAPEDLTAGVLRAAILRSGCLLVRGLIDRDECARLVDEIDLAFEARDAQVAGGRPDRAYYDELEPQAPFVIGDREWTGSVWVPDSPRLLFDVVEVFDRAGLRQVIDDYLGERPLLSVNKCTLRRVDPAAVMAPLLELGLEPRQGAGWHQDGAFLGEVRAMNVWLSLSRCGDVAPGLDIVPRRIDHIVPTGTEGAFFDWSVAPAMAEAEAADVGIVRPIFEPGDVLLFDDLLLHATGVSTEMKDSRHAVESWFFGASAFPADYVPIAY